MPTVPAGDTVVPVGETVGGEQSAVKLTWSELVKVSPIVSPSPVIVSCLVPELVARTIHERVSDAGVERSRTPPETTWVAGPEIRATPGGRFRVT